MVGALSDSWVLVQEYGGILEIIDVAAAKSIRRFSGVNPVVSSDRKLLAWETRVDSFSKVQPHILVWNANRNEPTDLGEGRAPVFASQTELLFFRQQSETSTEVVRYNTDTQREQVRVVKAPEYVMCSIQRLALMGPRLLSPLTEAGTALPSTGD